MPKMLERIFRLPSIGSRRMSRGWFRKFFFPWRFTERSDDTYLYYLCARTSFMVTTGLLALNWISLIFDLKLNFYFFNIYLNPDKFVESFSLEFPEYTSSILMLVVIPYYLVRFLWNINPKQLDILWWYNNISEKTKRKRVRVIPIFLFLLLSLISTMLLAFALPFYLILNLGFSPTSYLFFIVVCALFLVCFTVAPMYIIFSIIALYRYVGPYKNKYSSNSIQGGEQ